jgi:spore coat protein U-like protein
MMTGSASALLGQALLPGSTRTINRGRTTGTDTAAGTGNGSSQPYAVYGQTEWAQYAAPGAFADTITVTVTY